MLVFFVLGPDSSVVIVRHRPFNLTEGTLERFGQRERLHSFQFGEAPPVSRWAP
jgi:hypothetical protein